MSWFLPQCDRLDNERVLLQEGCSSLETARESLDLELQRLNVLEARLAVQQSYIADQLMHLTLLQDQMDAQQSELKTRAQQLTQREEQVAEDSIALAFQAKQVSEAMELGNTGLDARSKQLEQAGLAKPIVQPQTPQPARSADVRRADAKTEKERSAQALAALEARQRELDTQKHELQHRHRQLADDLSNKQLGLNEQWAALDIDQSRAEARERGLHSQSAELRKEWDVLQAEWSELEAQRLELGNAEAEVRSVQAATQLQSQATIASSEASQNMQMTRDEVAVWQESLEKQLSDLAREWGSVNAERAQLKQEREALDARAEAVAKADTARVLNVCDPFELTQGESFEITPIVTRGDSPRDLKEQRLWHSTVSTASSHCLTA